jgi:hypothetical protein
MNTNRIFALVVCLLSLSYAAISSQAQIDLNTRKAVYFTGAKTDSIDLKNDVYVASGMELGISNKLSTGCDKILCKYNVGIIAMRTGTGPLSTHVVINVDKGGSFTKAIEFADDEKIKQVVFPIKLAPGKNQLTLVIDANRKVTETDESNNRFAGTVTVNPTIGGTILHL